MKLDDVIMVLTQNSVPATTIKQIESDLKQIQQEERAEKAEKDPKGKNQWVVVAHSPTNDINNMQAWVMQIGVDDMPNSVLTKVQTAAKRYNSMTRKGKKCPVKDFSSAIQFVQRKFSKEEGYNPKNKTAVQVILTDNNL